MNFKQLTKVRSINVISTYQEQLKRKIRISHTPVSKKLYTGGAIYTNKLNKRITVVSRIDYLAPIIGDMVLTAATRNIYAYVDRDEHKIHVTVNMPANMGNINILLKRWAEGMCRNDPRYSVVLYDYKENWVEVTETLYSIIMGYRNDTAKFLLTA